MPDHDHGGHRERMRARFLEGGLSGFAPHEALEMLLYYAIPRRDTNALAHRLLKHFGSLKAVLEAPPEQLSQVPGIGEQTAVLLTLVQQIGRMADQERLGEKPVLTNLREARAYCALLFHGAMDEVLYVICLDAQGRVLRAVPAITGTIDEMAIYPRVIVGAAIRHNAHTVLLAHNHPSGVAEPSDADLATTEQLRAALGAVDIRLLDHIICAESECVSISQWEKARAFGILPQSQMGRAADTQRARRPRPSAMRDPEAPAEEDNDDGI